jgi:hypothetical protein
MEDGGGEALDGVGIRLRWMHGPAGERASLAGCRMELHLEHGDCLVCHASKPGCCDTLLHLGALKTRYRYCYHGGGASPTCHREKGPLDRNQDHRVTSDTASNDAQAKRLSTFLLLVQSP